MIHETYPHFGSDTAEWGNGYTAALVNFAFLVHAVLSTDDIVKALG